MKKIFLLLILTSFTIAQTKIEIKDPWLRPNAKGANSALFFIAENKTDKADTLIAAKFENSEVVELHETYKKSEDMMGMRAVKFVVIPPKSNVVFKPRDLHIMLIGLKKDIKIGENYNLSLIFKKAGEIKINAAVRDMPKMK
ncbi:MAG: copper chaperone PCu(A)C [Melioribacteraceae bacterium]|nr:copper chaperone PCu(A)C [Melioribacteraceae bacterium]